MLKVDLHIHTSDDPIDPIPHTTFELIDRAAELGFDAVAITLHDHQLDLAPFRAYAATRRIVLIPGVERTIEGRHVLLLNYSRAADSVYSFDDLARLREREEGLVIAPHPYFPAGSALRGALNRHAELFDAVEWNAMFTTYVNFNAMAQRFARRHGKPMVGNSDAHRLGMLGTTYSLVDAAPDADAICAAILAGRVEIAATPLTFATAARIMAELYATGLVTRRKPNPGSRLARPELDLAG